MIQNIQKTIERYKMFESGNRVVIAVSGGPDSIVLLHVLRELNIRLCLKMAVAHLDHNIRRGSNSDLVFVKRLASSYGLPFYSKRIDWKKEEKAASSEEVLRKLRYNFLLDTAKKFKANSIAVGHTRDDQAETVLMRILRGSGLYGLSAILPRRFFGGVDIVRPLIGISRREIMQYIKKRKLLYRVDKTNFEDRFLRNKIRQDLLPYLEKKYSKNIRTRLSNLALLVGVDYQFIEAKAQDFIAKNVGYNKGKTVVCIKFFDSLDISLRRIVLRRAIEMLTGDLSKLEFRHLEEIEDMFFYRPANSLVHLPSNLVAEKNKETLLLRSN